MSVSLDEQRYSRVYGDGEPDFIELPAEKPAVNRIGRRRDTRQTREADRTDRAVLQRSAAPIRFRADDRHAARRQDRDQPRWKRILVALITFERSTGYAISIVVHLSLILILSLFLIGGSSPTPEVVIDSTFTEELPSVGAVLTLEQTLPDTPIARIPVIGDVVAADGDGLGRFFGDGDGAQFFGLRDAGRDFVYIVDCSGSMQGEPIARARRELLDSIDELQEDQRFYVMFYADSPYLMFNESGPPRQFFPATAQNKMRLREWAGRIDADGGTEPERALLWALRLEPDAVFLLTDGRFGDIVDDVSSANAGGARIHTIAFMNSGGEDQLRRMADANGGTFRFVP